MPIQHSDIEEWLLSGAIVPTGLADEVCIGWGNVTWHAAPLSNAEPWFYFPDFFLRAPLAWAQFQYSAILSQNQLSAALESISFACIPSMQWQLPSKLDFERGFNQLQMLFKSGKLTKAVLYAFLRTKGSLCPLRRLQSMTSILKYVQQAPAFAYGFWNSSQGIIGATPEVLFCQENGALLRTMALAGTKKNMPHTMLQDPKLLHEHQIVVDDIAAVLAPLGTVELGPLQLLTLPNLTHLYTPLSLHLTHSKDFLAYLNLLHPTPALGGFPRRPAWQWLNSYARLVPRARFGAPVGYWNRALNKMACFVAIRNVLWQSDALQIGAGCGIVSTSSMEEEWQELLLKMRATQEFLKL